MRQLEPHLDAWLAKLPQDVAFRRVPVMFQQRWTPLAKIYYTLDALGVESKLSPDVFKAIHGQRRAVGRRKFYDWAATKGIDRNKAKEVFMLFAVDGKMKRALQLAQQYNVQSVPTRSDDVTNLPSTTTSRHGLDVVLLRELHRALHLAVDGERREHFLRPSCDRDPCVAAQS